MATARTTVNERTTRRPVRERKLPFSDHVLDLRNNDPDLFETYQPAAIAHALTAKLYPADLPHLNVVVELMEANLRTFRRHYDPNFDVESARPTPRTTKTPQSRELVAAVFGDFNVDTIMRDGRPLGEWTFGEFRKEHRGMAKIISQFADIDDGELVGDYLK